MTETYILGGYTKGRNQGISSLDFDPVTGHLSEPQLIAKLNQPTFLAYAKVAPFSPFTAVRKKVAW